jgi:hypothetical protein
MGHVMIGRERSGLGFTPCRRGGGGGSSRRGGLVGQERAGAIVVHFCCKMLDYGLCLHVQVPDHGIAVILAEHLDKAIFHLAAQLCHGSPCAS